MSRLVGVGESDFGDPSFLVSFAYLAPFLRRRSSFAYREWVLDSGAFTAHSSGTPVRFEDYLETTKRLLDGPRPPVEVFGLDVIGDWRASVRNVERMWSEGIEAIPTYHVGEPESVLRGIARDYPKIALGGMVLLHNRKRLEFSRECFARVWPKRIHGFGVGSPEVVLDLPWHSVDASSWEVGAARFGRWFAYGKQNLGIRGKDQNLRVEIEHYLRLEERARNRWRKESAVLGCERSPSVRLAWAASPRSRGFTLSSEEES